MKDSILIFLFLIPTFLFSQYPTTGNKSRLGWQTTGDGLIWRGVAGDTVNKPNNRNYPYFQLDTVNAVLYRYIATQGNWQAVGGGAVDIDSLIYATRFWVNSNFFPLQGGLLTGTGGSGFVGFPIQSSTPATPATGFSLYAGSTGNNISWMQPDGFFRRLVSPVTGTPRQYQFMARSYTLGDSADIANNVTSIAANYLATSNGTNLVARNLFDNNAYVGILNSKPFQLGQWTTAGRPTGATYYVGQNTSTGYLEKYSGSAWGSIPTLLDANTWTAKQIIQSSTTYPLQVISSSDAKNKISFNPASSRGGMFFSRLSDGSTEAGFGFYRMPGRTDGTAVLNARDNVLIAYDTRSIFQVNINGVSVEVASGLDAVLSNNLASVIFDVRSTTKGSVFAPRMTQAQRTAITPLTGTSIGMGVYQTNGTEGLYANTSAGWKRYLWEGDAVNTWLKPSLEAGSVNITQGRVNKLRFNQDSGYFHLKNGVIFLQHPTEKDPASALPQVIITSDTLARWNQSGAVVSIGTTLGANNATGYGYTMVGSYTRGIVNNHGGTFSSAFGYDIAIDSTARTVAIGTKIVARRTSDCSILGSEITYSRGVVNSHTVGRGNTVNRSFSAIFGDNLTTRFSSEYIYGTAAGVNHSFFGKGLSIGSDSTFQYTTSNDVLRLGGYGTPATTAAALSKTLSNYGVGFATDGTVTSREIKRDTTIYVVDADYDFSAAITTAQVAARYNRVIFLMTTTAAAGSDSELTLHTPDANLMQVEYLIHSVDEPAGFDNKIVFGTNNAVDSTNGLVTNYFPAAGDGIHIRAGLRSGVYKYRYSN